MVKKSQFAGLTPFKPEGEEALGRKVYGTKMPESVGKILDEMGTAKAQYIRQAIIEKLQADGYL
ncbi:hypothetical protein [Sphaerothrix gracilis]|uniref:hypothetical protein n=1 Tax=Sphaerothrix gracilis TaxID=3151835 RepID=UPI0031FC9346